MKVTVLIFFHTTDLILLWLSLIIFYRGKQTAYLGSHLSWQNLQQHVNVGSVSILSIKHAKYDLFNFICK
jgi:hypothetical protein